ncbi:PAS domain S-box protein [Stella sp.]|uniref:PAS domain S-box protein n=1 Tax=Stella sp. TaxID=2912054 RepID=UPI0035B304B0
MRRPAHGARAWAALALLGGACFLLALACMHLARMPGNGVAPWLGNALAVGTMLSWPAARRPAGLAAVAAAVFAAQFVIGAAPAVAAGIALAHLFEVWVALALAGRIGGGDASLMRRNLGALLAAGLVAPGLAAPAGAAVAAWATGTPFDDRVVSWWVGSALGAALVLPVALTVSRRAIARAARHPDRLWLGLHAALALGTVAVALTQVRYPFVLVPLPLLLAAVRLDAFRTAVVSTLTVAALVAAVAIGTPGFGPAEFAIEAQLAAALAILGPFTVAVLRDGLIASESRFRRAMDDSAIGMALVQPDGRFLRVNAAVGRLLGDDPDRLAGRSFRDVLHPDDIGRVLARLPALVAGQDTADRLEVRCVRRDGTAFWALLALSLVQDEASGEPRHFIAQIEDIDDRRRGEERLRVSESRWHFALESAGQGVWDHDLEAGTAYHSPTWKAMLGLDPDGIGTDIHAWEDLIHPDDRARVLDLDRRCRTGEISVREAEYRLRHADGHWIWVHDRGRVIERAADGRARRMIGTHTDITPRKQAEAAFQRLAERTQLAVEAAGLGIWELDVRSGAVAWDQRMHAIYGTDPATFGATRADWERCLHPDDLPRVRRELDQALAREEEFDTEFRILRPDGSTRHLGILGRIAPERDGRSLRLIGTHRDVTDQRRLTEALFEEKERLRITLYSIGDAVICTDAASRVTFMNPIAEQMTGWPMGEADRRPLDEVFRLVDEHTGEPVASPVEECLRHMRPFYLQDGAVLVSRDGSRMNVQDSAAPVRTASGEIIGAVLVFQDITRAHELQKQLTHSALHDALTGLPNRSAFELALQEARRKVAGSERATLCFLDLDRFKVVNDSAGHAAGDTLLRLVARTIKAMVRPNDVVARLGGDEFGILLRDCGVDEGQTIAQRVIEAVKTVRFPWEGRSYDVGASIGMTEISDRSRSYEDLLKEADVACYAAKAGGRNRLSVYVAGEGDAERYHRDIQVASGIRSAIEANRFRLYAQEIRDLRPGAGKHRHYEILLRLMDENGELTSPAAFIPAAERYDLMGSIDRWVISAILREHREGMIAHPEVSLAINLSANSLSDPLLWPFVLEEIRSSGIAADRLHFEITETAIINNFAIASQFVTAIRAAGARVVLDDFGSGLSSFAYLKQFEVDHMKIDGAFVRTLRTSTVDRRIVESINDVGHALGITTVAECVEDEATLEEVRRIGVDMAQGYYLGTPQPLDELFGGTAGRRPH